MKKAEKQFRLDYSRLVKQAGWSLFSILFFCYLRAVALTFAPGSLPEPEHIYPLQPDPVDIQSADSNESSNGLSALQIQPDSVCPGSFYRRQNTFANPAAAYDPVAQFVHISALNGVACSARSEIDGYTSLQLKACLPVRAGPAAGLI